MGRNEHKHYYIIACTLDDSSPSVDKDMSDAPTTTTIITTTAVDDDDKKESDDDDGDLYQVPPPAKPINNEDLPPNYLYTVSSFIILAKVIVIYTL